MDLPWACVVLAVAAFAVGWMLGSTRQALAQLRGRQTWAVPALKPRVASVPSERGPADAVLQHERSHPPGDGDGGRYPSYEPFPNTPDPAAPTAGGPIGETTHEATDDTIDETSGETSNETSAGARDEAGEEAGGGPAGGPGIEMTQQAALLAAEQVGHEFLVFSNDRSVTWPQARAWFEARGCACERLVGQLDDWYLLLVSAREGGTYGIGVPAMHRAMGAVPLASYYTLQRYNGLDPLEPQNVVKFCRIKLKDRATAAKGTIHGR
jgi:hypothetical protein